MQKKAFALSLGLVAGLFATQMAQAQGQRNCAERTKVIERLVAKYGESRQMIGLAGRNGVVEMHASPDTGTWTITVTSAAGVTCLIAAGTAFEQVEEELPAALGAPL